MSLRTITQNIKNSVLNFFLHYCKCPYDTLDIIKRLQRTHTDKSRRYGRTFTVMRVICLQNIRDNMILNPILVKHLCKESRQHNVSICLIKLTFNKPGISTEKSLSATTMISTYAPFTQFPCHRHTKNGREEAHI